MPHEGTPYTNRETCDANLLDPRFDGEELWCERGAKWVIFATMRREGGGVEVHAPMYVCESCFGGQLKKYAEQWEGCERLLTLTVVPVEVS